MNCNNCLQEIISGEDFYEDEAEGTKYHVNCKKAAIDRRDKAEARVAELQAALAAERDAHAWRPVTDDAPAPLEKVVVATRDDPDVAWRLPEVPHLWNTRRGRSLLTQEIAGYLPLPPQEPQ